MRAPDDPATDGCTTQPAAEWVGLTVQSEIHSHPDFERLEAAGMASHGRQVVAALMVVKKLAADSAFD